jgi:hypothetical protein
MEYGQKTCGQRSRKGERHGGNGASGNCCKAWGFLLLAWRSLETVPSGSSLEQDVTDRSEAVKRDDIL